MGITSCARPAGSALTPGVGDVGELYASLAARLERIVGTDVRAPRQLIEDACQMAWGRLWDHRDRVRRETVLPWLVTTAIREAVRLVRGEARCLSLERALEESGERAVPAHSPAAAEICEERARLELIGSLSERQQQLVWLHGLGFSYEEIAASTGSTKRTVERQLLRGKRKLRRLVEEDADPTRGGS